MQYEEFLSSSRETFELIPELEELPKKLYKKKPWKTKVRPELVEGLSGSAPATLLRIGELALSDSRTDILNMVAIAALSGAREKRAQLLELEVKHDTTTLRPHLIEHALEVWENYENVYRFIMDKEPPKPHASDFDKYIPTR
jgi:hypothetical protein